MSTIPSTSRLPSYTAVGGTERAASTGISAVLFNRGGSCPRRTVLQELEKAGFDYILFMEEKEGRFDLEDLSGRFPFVRFILLKEAITLGEAINLAAAELSGTGFFVLWNDHRFFDGFSAAKMAELFGGRRLCTVPLVQNSRFEIIPTLHVPFSHRKTFKVLPEIPAHEDQPSLFPYDWLGLYDRERFLRLGGFDPAIRHPHWQLMDFGFRAALWGESIRFTRIIRLFHDGVLPPADKTAEDSYRLFYLKNLAPEFRADHAYLPLGRFPAYLAGSGWDLLGAWAEFSWARRWVLENGSRFLKDARTVADQWEHRTEPALSAEVFAEFPAEHIPPHSSGAEP